MNWDRIKTTAWWEYSRRVRERGFIASIILTPLLMVAFSIVPSLLIDQDSEKTEMIAVVDSTGHLFEPLKTYVESKWLLSDGKTPRYLLTSMGTGSQAELLRADSMALAEATEGTVVIFKSADTGIYRSPNPTNIRLVSRLQGALETISTESKLMEFGIDTALYKKSLVDIDLGTVKLSKDGKAETSGFLPTFFMAIGGTLLLMFLVMTTGQSLVRSLVEEKSNRVMDLIVSTTTPSELMWGKLIGLSGLGVTQILAWGFIAIGIASAVAIPINAVETIQSLYNVLPLLAGYVILGYILYAAVFIGVGSLVSTEQEAQLATSYLILLMVLPIAVAAGVLQNPDASYVKILSFIPFMTSSMMMIRLTAKMPSSMEIIASFAVLAATTVFLVWASGRVFRTAILLYGKRPSPGEIIRWIRG